MYYLWPVIEAGKITSQIMNDDPNKSDAFV